MDLLFAVVVIAVVVAAIGFRNKRTRSLGGNPLGIDEVKRVFSGLNKTQIERIRSVSSGLFESLRMTTWIKKYRKYLISFGAVSLGVSIFAGVQAFQINTATPDDFIAKFVESYESNDVSALINPDYFVDAQSNVPVFESSISSALVPDSWTETDVVSRGVEGKWFVTLPSLRTYEVTPVDSFNWGFVSRTWKILGLKSAEVGWSFGSLTDSSQTVQIGSKTVTLAELNDPSNPLHRFRVFPGTITYSLSPYGFNKGVDENVEKLVTGKELPLSWAQTSLPDESNNQAAKIASSIFSTCLKKSDKCELIPWDKDYSSLKILPDDERNSTVGNYPDDAEDSSVISETWSPKACLFKSSSFLTTTTADLTIACSGMKEERTRYRSNDCYRKYSSWLGIYIDGCWGTRTDIVSEKSWFTAEIVVDAKLDPIRNTISLSRRD